MRFIFMLLPWLELLTLIQLGIETSALTALAYVLLTLFLGLAMLQRQGLFAQLNGLQSGKVLAPKLLVDEMALGFSGLLLMVPGVLTDCLALLVLIGPLRRRLARFLGGGSSPDPYIPDHDTSVNHTIEGSYRRVDKEK
jgi:UPF0716 protein FxsA